MRKLPLAALAVYLIFAGAALAADFPIKLISQTPTTITLGWDKQTNVAAYTFYADGKRVSHTFDGNRVAVTFSKVAGCVKACYGVEDLRSDGISSYPGAAVEPPPLPGAVDVAVTVGGNDSTCVRATLSLPCRTLNRAYQLARCGDTVKVAAGTYPNQQVNEVDALSGCESNVTFRAAPNETVAIPRLYVGNCCGLSGTGTNAPDHVTFRGFKMDDGFAMDGDANFVVFDRIDGGSFFIGGGRNVTVSNSDLGPCWSSGSGESCDSHFRQIVIDGAVDGLTIKGNTIHDFILNPGSQDHYECIRVGSGANITYRGNRFYNCEIYASTLTFLTGTILIENNWFQSSCSQFPPQCPRGTSIINIGDVPGTLIIRFNSFGPGETIGDEGSPASGANHRFIIGNILGAGTCLTGQATYSYNVFFGTGGATCGTNATYIGPTAPYVNPSWGAAGDYHLVGATAADNYVPANVPNSGAVADYDRDPRPAGLNRDAGADER